MSGALGSFSRNVVRTSSGRIWTGSLQSSLSLQVIVLAGSDWALRVVLGDLLAETT